VGKTGNEKWKLNSKINIFSTEAEVDLKYYIYYKDLFCYF